MPFQPTSSLPPIQGIPTFHYSPSWCECSIIFRADEVIVIGDPNNASYEWAIIIDDRVTSHSDAGYGQASIALRDGLNALHPEIKNIDEMTAEEISEELAKRGIDPVPSYNAMQRRLAESRKVPLVWREMVTGGKKSLLGHIQGDRAVTLYQIKITPSDERRGTLTGAFIPDEWDGEHPALVNSLIDFLKWQAELFLIEGYDRLHDIIAGQVEHPAEADANRLAQAICDWKASQGLTHTGDLLDDALDAHDLRHNA